ncbi:uncharacterized protein J4E79_006885 [Alternaria viburni]|uniref:uncharacterized protein n=1 Tax=Alternaria viburni TaxID=566460 RepID=UPI0020C3C5F3|nr:uncharacterized protein J4E79_006885 [Alternaria viburni]KAI4658479.1 hypothetical protein J4E79_006885 [Alternaria viburni]
MPPQRTVKTTYRQPGQSTRYSATYDPSQEYIDDEDSEIGQLIKADPYWRYVLKTGSYLRWMLTAEKACKGVDDDHIVRRGLIQWNNQAGYSATIPPSDDVPPYATGKNAPSLLKKLVVSVPSPERFKTAGGKPIWICGSDIIGLFHMQRHQLNRFGVKDIQEYRDSDKRFWKLRYSLEQVWEVAKRTPKCPLDQTPDEAVDRYLLKVQKCGNGGIGSLRIVCEHKDCQEMRTGGPSEAGQKFWVDMYKDMF